MSVLNAQTLCCAMDAHENKSGESIAVLLPTYCEAENIERLIRQIEGINREILVGVIDDSSPDDTAGVVENLQSEYNNIYLVSRKEKLGLGTAIVTGFRFFLDLNDPPDYIITMDSDNSHNPNDIGRLVSKALEGNDIVIGSRYVKGGVLRNWSLRRQLISRCANVLAEVVVGRRIRDCTSGFRCYSRDYVEKVLPALHSTTYEIQIETLRQSRSSSCRIKEVPITFVGRKRGKSKLSKGEIRAFLTYIGLSLLACSRYGSVEQ